MKRAATVRRNSKAYTAALTTGATFTVYTLSNGFRGQLVDADWARANLLDEARRSEAKMTVKGDGAFTLSFHSNRWYCITAAA